MGTCCTSSGCTGVHVSAFYVLFELYMYLVYQKLKYVTNINCEVIMGYRYPLFLTASQDFFTTDSTRDTLQSASVSALKFASR